MALFDGCAGGLRANEGEADSVPSGASPTGRGAGSSCRGPILLWPADACPPCRSGTDQTPSDEVDEMARPRRLNPRLAARAPETPGARARSDRCRTAPRPANRLCERRPCRQCLAALGATTGLPGAWRPPDRRRRIQVAHRTPTARRRRSRAAWIPLPATAARCGRVPFQREHAETCWAVPERPAQPPLAPHLAPSAAPAGGTKGQPARAHSASVSAGPPAA